jgi:maltose alpha-D-glucosyltransferase/alpha-amylase
MIPVRPWPQAVLLLVLHCGCLADAAAQGVAPATEQSKWTDPAYLRWLEERSMLYQAAQEAKQVSGRGIQWRHPYGDPQPRQAVKSASVWLLDYPGSVITRPGKSVLATWGDSDLWSTLEKIGIELLHTGPIKQAGGIQEREQTPSVDGWFDPISLEIDPELGTDEEYRQMVRTAARHGGLIAGDLVPLHTGMGADFRLAQRAYRDYPGLYTMVEVRREDWSLLPKVAGPWRAAVVSKQAAEELHRKGYLPGLINSNDATEKARDLSGWSATGEVLGVDGKTRRWVYLHYFKTAQPALNWLDPSYAAQRAVSGDVVKTIHSLGARLMRLDAVPFLGIEPEPGETLSRHFKHPLSVQGTNSLAFLIRKLGGFSFHELNIPLRELKAYTEHGPDLSYDFFTRAQCVHALLVQDATLLRQAFGFLLEADVQPISLVHDLQNHDEITYQLTELDARGDELFRLGGEEVSGRKLRERMLHEMRTLAAGEAAPHNKLYRPEKDGLATTFPGFIAAALKIRDPYQATRRQREQIRQAHLLLAAANAMQPGVFSLSSWDLVGALPIAEESVAKRTEDGDYRWVNRGGVDLMGAHSQARQSASGLPRADNLYGSLPEQLQDSESFVSQLQQMLAARKKHRLAEGELLAVPEVEHPAVCVLVMKVPGPHAAAITALNFGRQELGETVDLSAIEGLSLERLRGGELLDVISGARAGELQPSGRVVIELPALTGRTVLLRHAAD